MNLQNASDAVVELSESLHGLVLAHDAGPLLFWLLDFREGPQVKSEVL